MSYRFAPLSNKPKKFIPLSLERSANLKGGNGFFVYDSRFSNYKTIF